MRLMSALVRSGILSVALGACHSAGRGSTEPIRVLVYNIHAGKDAGGVENLTRVAAIVKESGASIVLLQEVDDRTRRSGRVNQLARLRELTGFHGIFGKAIDYDDGGYGIAILSRWRITAAAFAPLPVEIKDSVARAKYEARGALVTKISSPWGMIRVIDTHLDATRSDSNRVQQAKTLASLANAERDSGFTILGGDFNSEPASVVMQMLTNAGWKDLFAECGRGIPSSFPADVPVKRIDYLLAAGDAGCASASVIDTRASDHRPVLFEVVRELRR